MANADEVIKPPSGASENGVTFVKGEQLVLATEPIANAPGMTALPSGGRDADGEAFAKPEKESVRLNGSGEHESTVVSEFEEDSDEDVLPGETAEEALQRRIDEGKIGKGKTLRRWKTTEEKQRMVETGRHKSKVQKYDQIYEEVRALRSETRTSVRSLRERFNKEGVIQNKDQFIVRLIAQERNEHEGKVAAIKSLQQWRLTDVELHNFLNRCHKKGLDGKLDLAMQWAFEQEEAGGLVNFKEGLAFYSSIGILQPRSSSYTQQQWREWREWEDAMTEAIRRRAARGSAAAPVGNSTPEISGADASCNDDSTVCNSPWSSERGGGGGSLNGTLRSSSTHGDGDGASRMFGGSLPGSNADGAKSARVRRGRTPSANRDTDRKQRGWWQWRSYSPPGTDDRENPELIRRSSSDKRAMKVLTQAGVQGTPPRPTPSVRASTGGGGGLAATAAPVLTPGRFVGTGRLESPTEGGVQGRPSDAIVRASGGYLPPRHPLASLVLSPAPSPGRRPGGGKGGDGAAPPASPPAAAAQAAMEALKGEDDVNVAQATVHPGGALGTPDVAPSTGTLTHSGAVAKGAVELRAKAPIQPIVEDLELGDAPTEEEGPLVRAMRDSRKGSDSDAKGKVNGGGGVANKPKRPKSISGFMSGFADWLMPSMDKSEKKLTGANGGRGSYEEDQVLVINVYGPNASPRAGGRRNTKSAPATPRGRSSKSAVLRGGGWFYNGDSDYSTAEEDNYDSDDDAGFWGDVGMKEPAPRNSGGGESTGILERLRSLFT